MPWAWSTGGARRHTSFSKWLAPSATGFARASGSRSFPNRSWWGARWRKTSRHHGDLEGKQRGDDGHRRPERPDGSVRTRARDEVGGERRDASGVGARPAAPEEAGVRAPHQGGRIGGGADEELE